MSASVLREAATAIRRDTFNGQTEDAAFMEAVAAWLDACEVKPGATKANALAVARAYLGNP